MVARAPRDGTPRPHPALRCSGAHRSGAVVGGSAWLCAGRLADRTRQCGGVPRHGWSTPPDAEADSAHVHTSTPLGCVVGWTWRGVWYLYPRDRRGPGCGDCGGASVDPVAWVLSGATVLLLWLYALAPASFWWHLVRQEYAAVRGAGLVGVGVWGSGQIGQALWTP